MFGDHAMLIAAIDRLVHHSIIFEMNVESYRRRGALARTKKPGACHAAQEAQRTRPGLIDAPAAIISDKENARSENPTLASVNQERQLSSQARSQILTQIAAPSHPDCRATCGAAPRAISWRDQRHAGVGLA